MCLGQRRVAVAAGATSDPRAPPGTAEKPVHPATDGGRISGPAPHKATGQPAQPASGDVRTKQRASHRPSKHRRVRACSRARRHGNKLRSADFGLPRPEPGGRASLQNHAFPEVLPAGVNSRTNRPMPHGQPREVLPFRHISTRKPRETPRDPRASSRRAPFLAFPRDVNAWDGETGLGSLFAFSRRLCIDERVHKKKRSARYPRIPCVLQQISRQSIFRTTWFEQVRSSQEMCTPTTPIFL